MEQRRANTMGPKARMIVDNKNAAPVAKDLLINNLVANRGSFTLGPMDACLPFASITALVGANGAGKTTLTRVLLGQIPISRGDIALDDKKIDVAEASWRSAVGYVPDDPDELLIECTAEEFWQFTISVHALRFSRDIRAKVRKQMVDNAHELSQLLHFQPPPKQPIAEYSLGMRKKTQLVAALAAEPPIVIMDEPRNGLDPIGIEQLHRLLFSLMKKGTLVLLATHDLSWALAQSQQIIALHSGQIILASETRKLHLDGGEAYLLERLS